MPLRCHRAGNGGHYLRDAYSLQLDQCLFAANITWCVCCPCLVLCPVSDDSDERISSLSSRRPVKTAVPLVRKSNSPTQTLKNSNSCSSCKQAVCRAVLWGLRSGTLCGHDIVLRPYGALMLPQLRCGWDAKTHCSGVTAVSQRTE